MLSTENSDVLGLQRINARSKRDNSRSADLSGCPLKSFQARRDPSARREKQLTPVSSSPSGKTKDSWNDKTLNEFSKEISYVQKLKSKLGEKQFQNYINEYCIETENYSTYGMVTPCNIIPFLSYMDDLGLIDDVKNPIDVVEDSLRSVS